MVPVSPLDLKVAEMLNEHLPYRLVHIDGLCWACCRIGQGKVNESFSMQFSDNFSFTFDNSRPLTNALVESGIVYCRVLLNFLGIGLKRNPDRLGRKEGKDDDYTIKNIGGDYIGIQDVISAPTGQQEQIKESCIEILKSANKSVVHLTENGKRAFTDKALCCANTVLWLMEEFVYKRRGHSVPEYRIWTNQGGR